MMLGRTVMAAAALVAGAWFLSEGSSQAPAVAASMVDTGHGVSDETYRLTSSGSEVSCAITRHAGISHDRSELSLDPACAKILPAMAAAKFWQEAADGSVIFSENGIDPIVTFAVGDGVAFESIQPHVPLISLAAVE